jgi:hypothetical protein
MCVQRVFRRPAPRRLMPPLQPIRSATAASAAKDPAEPYGGERNARLGPPDWLLLLAFAPLAAAVAALIASAALAATLPRAAIAAV